MKNLAWTVSDMGDQHDRTVLITGANSGLGLASALAFAQSGARVLLACRSPERGGAALEQVRAVATGNAPQLIELDLADLASVKQASEQVGEVASSLDVLMNNAGVMALPLRRTAQGHEMQFGTNHLGHFALTARLLPLLLAAPDARVVTTSSGAHRLGKMRWQDLDWHSGYQKWAAYGQSKLANLMFCFELQRQAVAAKVKLSSLAAHPGYASTHLQAAGPELSGQALMGRFMDVANSVFAQSAEQGALPQLFAATSSEAVGGCYYGPSGLGEMRGAPRLVQTTSSALKRDEWEKLWSVSSELTELSFDWPN
jgi:NAD(P)-dependent dehydrogenase (short-subunit alcohol dehydrogenase family)